MVGFTWFVSPCIVWMSYFHGNCMCCMYELTFLTLSDRCVLMDSVDDVCWTQGHRVTVGLLSSTRSESVFGCTKLPRCVVSSPIDFTVSPFLLVGFFLFLSCCFTVLNEQIFFLLSSPVFCHSPCFYLEVTPVCACV